MTFLFITDEKMEYYHATFKISDLRVNHNSGPNSQYQFMELREISENLVSQIKFYHKIMQVEGIFVSCFPYYFLKHDFKTTCTIIILQIPGPHSRPSESVSDGMNGWGEGAKGIYNLANG